MRVRTCFFPVRAVRILLSSLSRRDSGTDATSSLSIQKTDSP